MIPLYLGSPVKSNLLGEWLYVQQPFCQIRVIVLFSLLESLDTVLKANPSHQGVNYCIFQSIFDSSPDSYTYS
jgi:hypothetical protein